MFKSEVIEKEICKLTDVVARESRRELISGKVLAGLRRPERIPELSALVDCFQSRLMAMAYGLSCDIAALKVANVLPGDTVLLVPDDVSVAEDAIGVVVGGDADGDCDDDVDDDCADSDWANRSVVRDSDADHGLLVSIYSISGKVCDYVAQNVFGPEDRWMLGLGQPGSEVVEIFEMEVLKCLDAFKAAVSCAMIDIPEDLFAQFAGNVVEYYEASSGREDFFRAVRRYLMDIGCMDKVSHMGGEGGCVLKQLREETDGLYNYFEELGGDDDFDGEYIKNYFNDFAKMAIYLSASYNNTSCARAMSAESLAVECAYEEA